MVRNRYQTFFYNTGYVTECFPDPALLCKNLSLQMVYCRLWLHMHSFVSVELLLSIVLFADFAIIYITSLTIHAKISIGASIYYFV